MLENRYIHRPTSRSAKRRLKTKFRTRRAMAVFILITLLAALFFKKSEILLYTTLPLSIGWIVGELLDL